MTDHELLNTVLGNVGSYGPSTDRGEPSMEPDAHGEWLPRETVEQAVLADLKNRRRPIGERLLEFYTEDEAEKWLTSKHPLLGCSAVRMIACGLDESVHIAIDALEFALEEGQVAT